MAWLRRGIRAGVKHAVHHAKRRNWFAGRATQSQPGASQGPMNGYRALAFIALRTTVLVGLAALLILVLLPLALSAQAAAP